MFSSFPTKIIEMQPHVYKTTKRGKARISVSPEKSGSNAHLTDKKMQVQFPETKNKSAVRLGRSNVDRRQQRAKVNAHYRCHKCQLQSKSSVGDKIRTQDSQLSLMTNAKYYIPRPTRPETRSEPRTVGFSTVQEGSRAHCVCPCSFVTTTSATFWGKKVVFSLL